jgi:hypothetical protein
LQGLGADSAKSFTAENAEIAEKNFERNFLAISTYSAVNGFCVRYTGSRQNHRPNWWANSAPTSS